MQPVSGDGPVNAFLAEYAGAFAGTVKGSGSLGVVIEAFGAPVIHEHADIEIVGTDDGIRTRDVMGIAYAFLHMLASAAGVHEGGAQGHGRGAGRAGHAFLKTGCHGVEPPFVGFQGISAKGGRGIRVEKHAVAVADFAQAFQRLGNGGGSITVHGEEHARPDFSDGFFHFFRCENLTPGLFDDVKFGSAAACDFAEEQAETAGYCDQNGIPGAYGRDEDGFDAGA